MMRNNCSYEATVFAIKENYFNWLVEKISGDDPEHSFWKMLRIFYETEFPVIVSMDANRALDGTKLRDQFAEENGQLYPDTLIDRVLSGPANSLETFVALAIRTEFLMYDPPDEDVPRWFWELMDNAGLDIEDDKWNADSEEIVRERLDIVTNRKYDELGNGGLFPLKAPGLEDRRTTELWIQMNDYIIENYPI